MLIEIVEYGLKTEETMKAMQTEIRENIWGTNSAGKDTGN